MLRVALLNSNTIAAVAGFIVALGPPPLRALFFGGPLSCLREAAANIARAAHAMLLITLGAALWPVPSTSDWTAVGGVCAAKLVGLPLATLGLLHFGGLASTLGLSAAGTLVVAIEATSSLRQGRFYTHTAFAVSGDAAAGAAAAPAMAMGCVPSALQISMMVQSTGRDARSCTVICFWQHVFGLPTMTAFLALALSGMP
mmetsp:Transcript_167975/g.534241  ORF Transcript_167975/g.534241 Transcript_167975/m.534241 type:complete len:200 (-) Transcript_167975:77-676(-)